MALTLGELLARSGDVEGAIGGAGGDAVAHGEGPIPAGGNLVCAELAVDSPKEVGELMLSPVLRSSLAPPRLGTKLRMSPLQRSV